MIAKHTPQSGMTMNWNGKRFVFDYVHPSKTLDHYEKYGHREMFRLPMHLTKSAINTTLMNDTQMFDLIKNGTEMLRVNVGAYISILIHIQSINNLNRRT